MYCSYLRLRSGSRVAPLSGVVWLYAPNTSILGVKVSVLDTRRRLKVPRRYGVDLREHIVTENA